jgi:cleavage and polyadenylation specificity factor subunit 1
LYGDSPDPVANGSRNAVSQAVATGPANIMISKYDTLRGVGKILDMEFGIATSDTGVRLCCILHLRLNLS